MCIQTNAAEAETNRVGTETESSVQEKQEEESRDQEEEGWWDKGENLGCSSDGTDEQAAKNRDYRSYQSIQSIQQDATREAHQTAAKGSSEAGEGKEVIKKGEAAVQEHAPFKYPRRSRKLDASPMHTHIGRLTNNILDLSTRGFLLDLW